MIRRSLLIGMICVMTLISACGKAPVEKPLESEKMEETEKNVIIEEEPVTEHYTEAEEDSLLSGVYKVPGYSIYVDVPEMHPIESGYTQIYFEDQVKYVTFSCIRVETAQDGEEAFEKVFKPFVNSMNGFHDINELGEITGENVTINNIDAYAFEGKVSCGTFELYDAYIKGYSFVYDDMPCAVIGVVMDREQTQEQIDAVKELVDAMILTVRSEQ